MLVNIISVYLFMGLLYFVSMITVFYKNENSMARHVLPYAGFDHPELIAFIALFLESLFWPIVIMTKKEP